MWFRGGILDLRFEIFCQIFADNFSNFFWSKKSSNNQSFFDDFFDNNVVEKVLKEFPGENDIDWIKYYDGHQKKLANENKFDGIAFAPPTIKREIQIMKLLEKAIL